MTPAAPMISLRNVTKSFGRVSAVQPTSLDIARGEFFSLLGPSGCGKTTLLRMIGGFEEPSSGDILIDSVSMTNVSPHRRPTNMVFQSYAIFPHLSVAQNVGYGLLNKKLGRAETEQRIDEALNLIQMTALRERMPHQLSGGQRQRVALARALVREPKVLLLDEPLGALDKKLRTEMQVELRRIHKQVGITFVLVTHDQEEALTLSDRIAVLESGRILQIGDSAELYERPTSRSVAAFIGTMNFLDGTVLGVEGASLLVDGGPAGRFRTQGSLFASGRPVTLAIRPERIALEWEEPAAIGRALRGTVVGETYLGDRRHYCVEVPGVAGPLWVAPPIGARAARLERADDATVWMSWSDDDVVVLDRT